MQLCKFQSKKYLFFNNYKINLYLNQISCGNCSQEIFLYALKIIILFLKKNAHF